MIFLSVLCCPLKTLDYHHRLYSRLIHVISGFKSAKPGSGGGGDLKVCSSFVLIDLIMKMI